MSTRKMVLILGVIVAAWFAPDRPAAADTQSANPDSAGELVVGGGAVPWSTSTIPNATGAGDNVYAIVQPMGVAGSNILFLI